MILNSFNNNSSSGDGVNVGTIIQTVDASPSDNYHVCDGSFIIWRLIKTTFII